MHDAADEGEVVEEDGAAEAARGINPVGRAISLDIYMLMSDLHTW